jgi:predicted nucleotidyltransferase component of viral defense system
MTREAAKNPTASIRARLLALAQSKGQDYQRVLSRYAIERFLYRLGESTHRDKFAIEGATLFTLWTGDTHRPTNDLDLPGWGSSAIREVEETIRAICKVEGDDGILFDGESVEGTRIREEDEYEGVRVKFHAVPAGARIPMQVDIGFGDAVYPERKFASFPVLLPMEAPVIRAYPREAAIAEKLIAMVVLDIRNSRMKDFYDIWFMANTWTFEVATLRDAIRASFGRRGVEMPQGVPFALTDEFLGDLQKTQQWNAFVSRLYPGSDTPSFEQIGVLLRAFLLPCILFVPADQAVNQYWTPSLHWSEEQSTVKALGQS